MTATDDVYLKMILDPIRISAQHKPKFGQNTPRGLTQNEFYDLYHRDAFYHWFGLDNPILYAAHRTAGGMSSMYRQIGSGCERLFRKILMDSFGLTEEDITWSYEISTGSRKRTLKLDGRIPLKKINDGEKRDRFSKWMCDSADMAGVTPEVVDGFSGTVFEVRQGYKSKDSKRQNADIANAVHAYKHGYFPCAVILSEQIDGDVAARYRERGWCVITGIVGKSDPLTSTYDFMHDVVGYDLEAFFTRNSPAIRDEINKVLKSILSTDAT